MDNIQPQDWKDYIIVLFAERGIEVEEIDDVELDVYLSFARKVLEVSTTDSVNDVIQIHLENIVKLVVDAMMNAFNTPGDPKTVDKSRPMHENIIRKLLSDILNQDALFNPPQDKATLN